MADNIFQGSELVPPQDDTKRLVIMFHGLGANGQDLIGLAPYFAEELSETAFLSPDAPFDCDMAPVGKQWFSLANRDEAAILEGVQKVAPDVNRYIDEQLERFKLKEEQLILLGFSQGAMLALHVGLRREKPIAGILGYSGALVGATQLQDEIKSKPEICLVHGEDDMVVPFMALQEALVALQGANLVVHGYSRQGLGHGIDPAGVKIGIEFIKSVSESVTI